LQLKTQQTVEKENFKKQSKSKFIKRVWSFLLVWSTKNNFFVTVIDSKGHTLVTRTGGNSEWTGTRQWSTVFSADNAVYEACFLAKQRGVESLSLHVWSTFWLPQIKNCFEGLDASGLSVDELLYRPLRAFGGCRRKKPRRV
jgi:ribosomal protein S11